MAYNAIHVIDDENFACALEANIQLRIFQIGTVRKTSIEPMEWGITLGKLQKTIRNMTQCGMRMMCHRSFSR